MDRLRIAVVAVDGADRLGPAVTTAAVVAALGHIGGRRLIRLCVKATIVAAGIAESNGIGLSLDVAGVRQTFR